MNNVKLRAQLRGLVRVLFVLALCACAGALGLQAITEEAFSQAASDQQLAPFVNDGAQNTIRGEYIMVLKPGTSLAQTERSITVLGVEIVQTFRTAILGYFIRLPTQAPDDTLKTKQALQKIPGVKFIEANLTGRYQASPQINPPDGLDRIDQPLPPLNQTYNYTTTGMNVHVYVIDSGIWTLHGDFGGRASEDFAYQVWGTGDADVNGHGTHVAAVIGGTVFGVAKNVTLHSVRVNRSRTVCDPNEASVVAAVEWVTVDHLNRVSAAMAAAMPVLPSVANMSLSLDGPSDALDEAMEGSIHFGVTYVVSASDISLPGTAVSPTTPTPVPHACTFSPGRLKNAITVGGMYTLAKDDADMGLSRGQCIDIFAPGASIVSAMPDGVPEICGPGSTLSTTPHFKSQRCSGNSASAAHVTGCAARVLESNPTFTPAQVWAEIRTQATDSSTTGWGGLKNLGLDSPNVSLFCR